MKKNIFTLSLVLLTLCACKGRTASVPVSDGDTVEVIVNNETTGADADTSGTSGNTQDTYTEPAPRPDETPVLTPESPAAAAGIKTTVTKENGNRVRQGDVTPGKTI